MFSSNNSNSENSQNYPTQWALNPSAYQNVSNESVDWAALAQQWIMMKESVPPEHHPKLTQKEMLNEGGEAPMDVENEKEELDEWTENSNSTPSGGAVHDQWNWQQWGTSWPGNWNGPPPQTPQPTTVVPLNKTALLPTPYYGPPGSDANNSTSGDFPSYDTSAPISTTEFNNSNTSSSGGYWTNSGRGKYPIKGGRLPRKGFQPELRPEVSEPVTLDAARRRQLPAWIREGLEKMEREKQKQLDKERERIEREAYLSRKKEIKNDALELLRSADGNVHPPKSKFDSDSGDSGDEDRTIDANRSRIQQPLKSRRGVSSPRSSSPPIPMSEEERMAWVRRAMTEVLLQVTSSEIESICQEELNRFRSRTSAKKGGRLAAPGAGPPAAGTLGLGIYGGGSSESDSDTENESRDGEKSTSNNVNNEEAQKRHQTHRESIKRRRSESQSRRSRPDAENSDSSLADKGSGDSQVDTTRSHGQSSRGRRHRSPRSTSESSTSSSETKKPRNSKNSKKRHSSSSEPEDDDSSSDSKSDSSGDKNTDLIGKAEKRYRSKSVESEKRHERSVESDKKRLNRKTRSASTESDTRSTKSKDNRKRTESVASNRTHHSDRDRDRGERSRRDRSKSRNHDYRDKRRNNRSVSRSRRQRSLSRSRSNSRSRRSGRATRRSRSRTRSRERERYEPRRYDRDRDRRRTRTRTRSRERRQSYRSRRSRSERRSRSRSRSRSGGGKRRGH